MLILTEMLIEPEYRDYNTHRIAAQILDFESNQQYNARTIEILPKDPSLWYKAAYDL